MNLEPGPLPSLAFVCDSKDEDSLYKILKRVTDLLFCVFVFVLLIVSYLPIALLVASESKGPIIFKQSRVGKNLANFSCWKFRTMTEDTKDAASHLINPNSVTKWGKFLRRFKVDELPQIKNIIVGEMSLVGPRPCLPSQLELIDERKNKGVFSVLPGITGLAQINGIDMSKPKLLAMTDAEYLATRSLILDLKLIWKTAMGRNLKDQVRF